MVTCHCHLFALSSGVDGLVGLHGLWGEHLQVAHQVAGGIVLQELDLRIGEVPCYLLARIVMAASSLCNRLW